MNNVPREKLCELVAKYGESLCDEPLKCEGLLRDLCGQYRLEINVLIDAIKERIPADLRSSSESVPIEVSLARLTKRFQDHRGATPETARWVVESWALALGKISEHDLSKYPVASAPPPRQGMPASRPQTSRSAKGPTVGEKISDSHQAQRATVEPASETASRSHVRKLTWALVLIVVMFGAGFAALWYFAIFVPQRRAQGVTTQSPTRAFVVQPSLAPSAAPTAAGIQVTANPSDATKEHPWVNSLGMKFVPVLGKHVLFSIWDTRVQDYQTFVDATQQEWPKPSFEQGPTHPAVNVSWDDAEAFCAWLTEKEREEGKLGLDQKYRLPTDVEWSVAVGLPQENTGNTPAKKDGKIRKVYPWGREWPPPTGAGNYDQSLNLDGYSYTSPVGSFESNEFGLYDMGGNVCQWSEDWYDERHTWGVLRGASWSDSFDVSLRSSCRYGVARAHRSSFCGFRVVLGGSALADKEQEQQGEPAAAAPKAEEQGAESSTLLRIGTGYRLDKNNVLVAERYGFIDEHGLVVIKPQWEDAGPFREGLAWVRRDGKFGYIDKTGRVVIDPRWDPPDFLNFFKARNFSEGLACVVRDGEFGYIDKTGRVVIEPQWKGCGDFSEGLASILRDHGKWGYIDKTGRVVIDPRWDWAGDFKEGLAAVGQHAKGDRFGVRDGKHGFIDKNGHTVIKPQFAFTSDFGEGLASVLRDGKFGYIDKTGRVVIEPRWSVAREFSEGLGWVTRQGDSKSGYIDRTGRVVIEPQWGEAATDFTEGVACVRGWPPGKYRGKYGLIDKTGGIVIEPQWDYGCFESFHEASKGASYWLFARQEGNKVVVVWFNQKGEQIWSSDSQ